ncbi:MAG: CDP-alcohol phosphatidyltransferase family protein [Marinifilum sp.]|jgi:CDP-diacylglycerol--serine O-phosphatidyltransferase|nr:CDP-alcohol phosphatidyltransferase family protein [Marinifilum sp.]
MSIVKHIPNTITCLNLFSGCTASLLAVEGHLVIAAVLIIVAAVFDFCDGLSARLLKAYSPMGKELDSLADMVSFGFAPGVIALGYLKYGVLGDVHADFNPTVLEASQMAILLSAFIIPVFSGLRLAKFNIDTRQTESFIGVNTPTNAMFWASIPLVLHFGEYPFLLEWLSNPLYIIIAIVITSLLLVAEIPMFALKVKNLSWQDNKIRYLFLMSLILLAVLVKWLAIPLVIFVYILFSVIDNLTKNK